jgi:hypothetical protein
MSMSMQQLQQLQAALGDPLSGRKRDALERGNWIDYLTLHGNHEGLQCLRRLFRQHGDRITDEDYWRLVADAWTGHDVVHPDLPEWRRLFGSPRPGREHLMTDDERARLAGLPDRVTVHRGFGDPAGRLGMAWTLDRERAEWFARDFAGSPRMASLGVRSSCAWVATVVVPRGRIVACFAGRDESEVIVPNLRGYRPTYQALS